MPVSGSTYPDRGGYGYGYSVNANRPLVNLGGFTGQPDSMTPSTQATEDPAARTGAVLQMMPWWQPMNINIEGTECIKRYSEYIIPREPREDDEAYNRRIFHAVLPPFVQRLASQAAGTILRRGIHLEGGDEEYWAEWSNDVTGDGTTLNEFARRLLVDAILFGHSSCLVDYPNGEQPRTLAEQIEQDRKPYLVPVNCQQIRGWRTVGDRRMGDLTMVRYHENISSPVGDFGEEILEQVRVLYPGRYELYRNDLPGGNAETGWYLYESGEYSLDRIPMVTVYSNQLATLMSKPPLLEVANLSISYCQRFTDYHHCIHVGSQPILVLQGFDPDSDSELGLSVNTAVLLPPDGSASYVQPTSDAYESQMRCLEKLEQQIDTLGISTLAQQNITNAAAEAKRLDRIDSDSIMAIISENLEKGMMEMLKMAAEYAGVEPPASVTIPKDYENRLLDGNQITAMLQMYMQGVISKETLLRIMQEGEVLPPYIEIDEEVIRTEDEAEARFENELEEAQAMMEMQMEAQPEPTAGGGEGGVSSGNAAQGSSKGNNTLPTPLRPGKHSD